MAASLQATTRLFFQLCMNVEDSLKLIFLKGLSGRSIAEVLALVNEYPSDLEIYLLNGSKPFQDVSFSVSLSLDRSVDDSASISSNYIIKFKPPRNRLVFYGWKYY